MLFVDDDSAADRGEEAFGERHMPRLDIAAAAERGDACAEHRRGIRHGADDGDFFNGGALDGLGTDRGSEGDEEFVGGEGGADFFDERGDLKRLDADQDDVGLAGDSDVVGRDFDAPLRRERGGALGVGDGGEEAVGREDLLLEERLKKNAAHFAGAEDGDAGFREIGHGDFRIASSEPGAGSREPGAGSREPGAGSREPGAGSREPEPRLFLHSDPGRDPRVEDVEGQCAGVNDLVVESAEVEFWA